MLQNEPGAKDKTIVEASSGSTVLSLGILGRVLWGHEDVHAYVTNKKHPNSLKMLRFFGLKMYVPFGKRGNLLIGGLEHCTAGWRSKNQVIRRGLWRG
jgi:cysteine synthase